MNDQAYKLRKMVQKKANKKKNDMIKIYSIVSGKGGVGKTNLSVNLGIKLQQMGKKVLLFDADIGMANADVLVGLKAKYDLFDYISGEVSLDEIIAKGPYGMKIISGGSGIFGLQKLTQIQQQKFVRDLVAYGKFDTLIIDNGAGISKESLTFITFSHEVILITTPEPTAITDAYCILKAIATYKLKDKVRVIVNQIPDLNAGKDTFNKLYQTSRKFLNIELEETGYIFDDVRVGKAVMSQQPFILSYPNSLATKNIVKIANLLTGDSRYNYNISSIQQLSNRFIKIFG